MKPAFQLKHASKVTVWAFLLNGKPAGKLIANKNENNEGSTLTVSIHFIKGPLAGDVFTTKINGSGYDELGQAISNFLFHRTKEKYSYNVFVKLGYTIIKAL